MSKPAHTPAPWIRHGCVADGVISIFNETGTKHICDVQIDKDAQLIAAAPDMLHVLKNLQAYSQRMREAKHATFSAAYDFQINSAIKKATA